MRKIVACTEKATPGSSFTRWTTARAAPNPSRKRPRQPDHGRWRPGSCIALMEDLGNHQRLGKSLANAFYGILHIFNIDSNKHVVELQKVTSCDALLMAAPHQCPGPTASLCGEEFPKQVMFKCFWLYSPRHPRRRAVYPDAVGGRTPRGQKKEAAAEFFQASPGISQSRRRGSGACGVASVYRLPAGPTFARRSTSARSITGMALSATTPRICHRRTVHASCSLEK